jgi:cysteine-rich repeat protein
MQASAPSPLAPRSPQPLLLLAFLAFLASLASCGSLTERTANVCCTSDSECAQLGLPPGSTNEYGCAEGHVCRDFYCMPKDATDAGVDAQVDAPVDAPRCGDGILTSGEQCDDGNTASGDGCSATCVLERRCGNGIVDPGETCDDGNLTCGTCSADCQVFASARATGTIEVVAGNDIGEGDTFTLGDGINSPPLTFTFTKNGYGSPLVIQVGSFATATNVRDRVAQAINSLDWWLIADPIGSATLSVTNAGFTSAGNIPMSETVAAPLFRVTGMSGGSGGNCAAGQMCRSNNDCLSNSCSLNTCQ